MSHFYPGAHTHTHTHTRRVLGRPIAYGRTEFLADLQWGLLAFGTLGSHHPMDLHIPHEPAHPMSLSHEPTYLVGPSVHPSPLEQMPNGHCPCAPCCTCVALRKHPLVLPLYLLGRSCGPWKRPRARRTAAHTRMPTSNTTSNATTTTSSSRGGSPALRPKPPRHHQPGPLILLPRQLLLAPPCALHPAAPGHGPSMKTQKPRQLPHMPARSCISCWAWRGSLALPALPPPDPTWGLRQAHSQPGLQAWQVRQVAAAAGGFKTPVPLKVTPAAVARACPTATMPLQVAHAERSLTCGQPSDTPSCR